MKEKHLFANRRKKQAELNDILRSMLLDDLLEEEENEENAESGEVPEEIGEDDNNGDN